MKVIALDKNSITIQAENPAEDAVLQDWFARIFRASCLSATKIKHGSAATLTLAICGDERNSPCSTQELLIA